MSSTSNETSSKSSEESDLLDDKSVVSVDYEQNETISKIRELLDLLTTENEDIESMDTLNSNDLSEINKNTQYSKEINETNNAPYSYVELLALYESELKFRTECK